jgi:putative membrane protein
MRSNRPSLRVYGSENFMEASHTKPALLESMAAGAIGGLVGALAMNQFQAAVNAVGESLSRIDRQRGEAQHPDQKPQSSEDDATVKAANAIAKVVFKHQLTGAEKKWAGPVVHCSMGAKLGALYGALAPSAPVECGAGTAYGTAVWLGADEIAVPLFGLSKLPAETPLSAHVNAWASHLVFGLVLHFTRKIVLS